MYLTEKKKKKKDKPCNRANLTVAESAEQYFDDCNYDMTKMLHIFKNHAVGKVPEGDFIYDTGADVHVCNDASLHHYLWPMTHQSTLS